MKSFIAFIIAMFIVGPAFAALTTDTIAYSTSLTGGSRASLVPSSTGLCTAIQSALTTLGGTNVVIDVAPAGYFFSSPCIINIGNNFVLNAQGSVFIGPGGSSDTIILTGSSEYSRFNFGWISAPGTGAAIHSEISGIENWFTWQALTGNSQQGKGFYLDATGTGNAQGVGYISGTEVSGFDHGIDFSSTTNIDTMNVSINYLHNNNVDIYEHYSGGNPINSNTWNVNLDSSWSATAKGVQTNGQYDVWNATIGGFSLGNSNIQLDLGAIGNTLNLTPPWLAYATGSIVDNSGATSNRIGIGAPIGIGSADKGYMTEWSSTDNGSVVSSGIYDAGSAYGIGTKTPKGILDLTSTTKSFIPPRMTTAQKNAITSPCPGSIVFDSTLKKLSLYTGTDGVNWEDITSIVGP